METAEGCLKKGTFHFKISKPFQMRSDPVIRATHPLLRAAALHSGKDASLWKCNTWHLQLLVVQAKMFTRFPIFIPNQRKTSGKHRSNQGAQKRYHSFCHAFCPAAVGKTNIKEDHQCTSGLLQKTRTGNNLLMPLLLLRVRKPIPKTGIKTFIHCQVRRKSIGKCSTMASK